MPKHKSKRFVGLDLGKKGDFTALAIVEKDYRHSTRTGRFEEFLACTWLQRWPLLVAYPEMVRDVKAMFEKAPTGRPLEAPLRGATLVIDETGVGAAVTDMFRAEKFSGKVMPVVITGGSKVSFADGTWRVSKLSLVSVLTSLFEGDRLKISKHLPLGETLKKELGTFSVKVTAAGNETFEAARERDHDDIVLALALACWAAERDQGGGVPPSVATVPGWQTFPVPMNQVNQTFLRRMRGGQA